MLLLQPTILTPHATAAGDSNPDLDLLHRASLPRRRLLHWDLVRKLGHIRHVQLVRGNIACHSVDTYGVRKHRLS